MEARIKLASRFFEESELARMPKDIILIDFDGTIHSYTSKCKDVTSIPDPILPGFLEWAAKAKHLFKLCIYSGRSQYPEGLIAMQRWLKRQIDSSKVRDFISMEDFEWPIQKPSAFLTIDDRAIRFEGDWTNKELEPRALKEFKPWNKK